MGTLLHTFVMEAPSGKKKMTIELYEDRLIILQDEKPSLYAQRTSKKVHLLHKISCFGWEGLEGTGLWIQIDASTYECEATEGNKQQAEKLVTLLQSITCGNHFPQKI